MDAKQLIADIFATIDSGDYRRVSELIHEDYVEHNSPLGGEARGPEGFLAETRQCAGAFSEGHSEIDLLVAEGDLAVWCSTFTCVHTGELMGVPPHRTAGVVRDPQHRTDKGRQGSRALGPGGRRRPDGAARREPGCVKGREASAAVGRAGAASSRHGE